MQKQLLSRMLVLTLFLIITMQLVTIGLVYAQPVPIGESPQAIPYESNPGAGTVSGFGTLTGPIENAFDGMLDTNINFYYGATASGVLELTTFDSTPATTFTIGYVDFRVSYKAAARTTNDQYRILYYVGTAGPIILEDWTGAKFEPSGGAQAHRVWSNQAEPTDGVWSWTDIADVKVVVEGNWGAATNEFKRFYLYEAWLTIAPAPLPPGTPGAAVFSVQPSEVAGLTAGTPFFVDLYVGGAEQMFGYEIMINYDTTILTALEYFSFHPFNNALPSEIDDVAGYVAISFSSYFGDPNGLTGNSPMARIYFLVDADGNSPLHFSKMAWTNVFGDLFTAGTQDGTFSTSAVPEFPLGLSAMLMLAPVIPIVYLWRIRRRKVR